MMINPDIPPDSIHMENTCRESCIKNIDNLDQLTVTNGILVTCILYYTIHCIAILRTKICQVGKQLSDKNSIQTITQVLKQIEIILPRDTARFINQQIKLHTRHKKGAQNGNRWINYSSSLNFIIVEKHTNYQEIYLCYHHDQHYYYYYQIAQYSQVFMRIYLIH